MAGPATCATCASFRNDPAALEHAFPGLGIMSSARGAVRASDGLCSRHDLYLPASATCNDHHAVVRVKSAVAARP